MSIARLLEKIGMTTHSRVGISFHPIEDEGYRYCASVEYDGDEIEHHDDHPEAALKSLWVKVRGDARRKAKRPDLDLEG